MEEARRSFCRCRCYFSHNIYIKSLHGHFTLCSREQFLSDYSQAEAEVRRRKEYVSSLLERRQIVQSHYRPKHPEIFHLEQKLLHPLFLQITQFCENPDTPAMELLETYKISHKGLGLYHFPVFQTDFCNKLLEELECFESSGLPKTRPNTMNMCGTVLDELGMSEFFGQLRSEYLEKLSSVVYPEWIGSCGLDSHRAFTVVYSTSGDKDLSWHFDNAEVTLNVSLTENYGGSELVFLHPTTSPDSAFCSLPIQHKKGWGILHTARTLHSALPILYGERTNLILWMRSSDVRNKLCPMCRRPPDLVPVQNSCDWGDGFLTQQQSVQVCSVV